MKMLKEEEEEKKIPESTEARCKVKKSSETAAHVSQAIGFKAAGIPKEKHTFLTGQAEADSRKINLKTKSKHKEQCHSSVSKKWGKVGSVSRERKKTFRGVAGGSY